MGKRESNTIMHRFKFYEYELSMSCMFGENFTGSQTRESLIYNGYTVEMVSQFNKI